MLSPLTSPWISRSPPNSTSELAAGEAILNSTGLDAPPQAEAASDTPSARTTNAMSWARERLLRIDLPLDLHRPPRTRGAPVRKATNDRRLF